MRSLTSIVLVAFLAFATSCAVDAAGQPGPDATPERADAEDIEFPGRVLVSAKISELSQYVATCNAGNLTAVECRTAFHRACRARGYFTGTGPLDLVDDAASMLCLRDDKVDVLDVSFAQLTEAIASCNEGSVSALACRAGVNRLCSGQGFVSGFGPFEANGAGAKVACFASASAEVVGVSYVELGGFDAACAKETLNSANCYRASHQACAAKGFLAGMGPVEAGAEDAAAVCIHAASL